MLHYPSKDKCLMWPGFYEDAKDQIDSGFEETDRDIKSAIGFHALLENGHQPYKVFVKKTKQK